MCIDAVNAIIVNFKKNKTRSLQMTKFPYILSVNKHEKFVFVDRVKLSGYLC